MSAAPYPLPETLGSDAPVDAVQVDFLLPTGVLIVLHCGPKQSLEEIKEVLWDQAKELPLFNRLKQPEWYTLVFVNLKAEQEECLNEADRICDLQMYRPLFKVMEKKGDHEEKMLGTKITWLIGKCLKDFDNSRDPEVTDFRVSMVDKCRVAIVERGSFSWEQKMLYCFPPDIESSTEISSLVQSRLSPTVPPIPLLSLSLPSLPPPLPPSFSLSQSHSCSFTL